MPRRYRHLAEYYDGESGRHAMLEQDVPFFLGQLPRRRQTILELAVGTGRAAIPLAQAGHAVIGMDYARDMLDIARRKRDGVGLSDRQLRLVYGDVTRLALGRRFDWVCIFFNTFLAFTTLDEQDRVLQAVRRHMKPSGRFWIDIFNPDLSMIADPKMDNLEPHAFFVPRFGRTVGMTTSLRRIDTQVQHVTFHYTWFDEFGRRKAEKTEFDMTYIFPRELQILLERNGLKIERLWGNYDGAPVAVSSPRIIARCCRM
jgi:ubiquinone/menaquinone biosynthesis C-methylase UbiE